MKIKKALALLLANSMLYACSSSTVSTTESTSTGGMTPGTYTSTQTGYASDFDVTVTVDETSITDISIGDNNETESVGGRQLNNFHNLSLRSNLFLLTVFLEQRTHLMQLLMVLRIA